jgi:hypothetical protein
VCFFFIYRPYKLIKCTKRKANVPQKDPVYDLDNEDVEWLKALNNSRKNLGKHMHRLY